jgi:ParB family transcriptional regulator, chromosome partitioning protein
VDRALFDDDGEGYLIDPDLLNRLVREKLRGIAQQVIAEGWKWVTVEPEYDYQLSAGMRRLRPAEAVLTDEQRAKVEQLEAEYDALYEQGSIEQDFDEPSEDIAAKLQTIEAEIIALTGGERYRPEDMAQAGAFVALGCDGETRIERGFVRSEDSITASAGEDVGPEPHESRRAGDAGLSDKLLAELSAYRTSALRHALGQQPAMAFLAVVHAVAAQTFYFGEERSCLNVKLRSAPLTPHGPGIDESPAERQIVERHEAWAKRMPQESEALWGFVATLSNDERFALLAHCVSQTVDALQDGTPPDPHGAILAEAVALDMTAYWQPTAASYFVRVSKDRILEAVREGVSEDAARGIAGLKKQAMAERAEQLLTGTGWLPAALRPRPETEAAAGEPTDSGESE